MILVMGGAYQGKLDYAKKISKDNMSVFQCTDTDTTMDFSKNIINSFHLFVLAQIKNNIDTKTFLEKNIESFKDKIIICDDLSCGIVPIDSEMRNWRETTSRGLCFLAKYSHEVFRIFCGLELKLK